MHGASKLYSTVGASVYHIRHITKHTVIDKMIKAQFQDTCARFDRRHSVYCESEDP